MQCMVGRHFEKSTPEWKASKLNIGMNVGMKPFFVASCYLKQRPNAKTGWWNGLIIATYYN